nr:unnamed protein product [Callosobruchus analis]
MVYQLQRRVRNLREQVQRKDLHLDLLRRKLSLQEDTTKAKCLLQQERDEANARVKKLVKQVDRLQLQLAEAKSQIRELNSQLAEAADYKVRTFIVKTCINCPNLEQFSFFYGQTLANDESLWLCEGKSVCTSNKLQTPGNKFFSYSCYGVEVLQKNVGGDLFKE